MHFRSLESRIVSLFLLTILAVQLAGFFFIRSSINENARASVRNELLIGEHVFNRLLEQNAEKLANGAAFLSSDFGFKTAISSDDRETITSALISLGDRISAKATVFVGLDRTIKASTLPAGNWKAPILQLVDKAEQAGSATATSIVGNIPYQIVTVPVKAPLTAGWISMAFPIDQKLANLMSELSPLQTTILIKQSDGGWKSDASTLTASNAMELAAEMRGLSDKQSLVPRLNIGGSEYGATVLKLTRDGDAGAVVVLQRSVSEAIAPYNQLQITLLILTALSIVIAVVISIVTAKRIAGPLRQLADTAKRLGAGDYRESITTDRNDEIGDLSRAFESMRDDISKREVETGRLAYWDRLTNLPNRLQFVNLLDRAIEQANEQNRSCCVLMMGLDRFKNVNDVLGHGVGDALLRQVGERLKLQVVASRDIVARVGGDEFVVLLPASDLDEAKAVAAQIMKSLELPILFEEQTIDLGAGIGIAAYPAHGSDAESLLQHAEAAMYVSKKTSDEAAVYDPATDKTSKQNLSLLSELRRAIDENQFRLQVQPKILLATGRITGLEALIRWIHPEKGMIFPDNFIPFAEKTGFIRKLTLWVLEQSAMMCSQWEAQGIHLKISVNLSARDLLDQDLPAKFAEILMRNKVAPTSFCLEITESAIMDDPLRAQQTLERLHAMNVELAIDDFGTGYSSLAYLKRLPVDELKIDKSFVMNMECDADDAKIVRSTIDLGHNMGLRVVAEGIESEAVWKLLANMGCDQGQGYFMSKPMPADQFLDWMQNWVPPKTNPTPAEAHARQST